VRECPHCGARNGVVKKVGFARIIHEKIPAKDNSDRAHRERDDFVSSFDAVVAAPKGKFENNQMSGADVGDLCAASPPPNIHHTYIHTRTHTHAHTHPPTHPYPAIDI